MHESIAKCLVFTSDGRETAERLVSLLREQGIRVVRSTRADECLGSLDAHGWRFLAVDATVETEVSLDVLARARQSWPDLPVLAMVNQGDTHTAVQAMKAGAFDCVETPIDAAVLRSTVDAMNDRKGRRSDDPLQTLTRVERIVLSHVLEGRTNREIGDALCRSPRTVEVHRRHIMQKLSVSNLIDLVKRVMRTGAGEQRLSDESSPDRDWRPETARTEQS